MIRLLRFLLTGDGHNHQWEILQQGPIFSHDKLTVGTFYDCRCSVCGKIKSFKV